MDHSLFKRAIAIVSLLSLTGAARLCAQDARRGAWMDLGLGYGSASFSCDTCTRNKRLGGWTLSGGGGGTLSPHFRLGAELRVWLNGLKAGGAPLPGIVNLTVALSYYQRRRGGPFVMGGAGLSGYGVCKGRGDPLEPCANDASYDEGWGWGETLGVGWDIPRGRGWFRPFLAYHHGRVPRLRLPDHATVATGWNQDLLTIELRF